MHSWERIGAALCFIARRYLTLAVFRYVDDFFGIEVQKTMEHATQCFARLVSILLGKGALAESKLVFGRELSILGC